MRWRELPGDARRYILYHTLIAPTLIAWYMLPYYVLRAGYSVVEAGALFTAIHLLGIPVTITLGRVFKTTDLRRGLLIIHLLDSSALIFYSLAYGPLLPLMVIAGGLLEESSGMMYFLYPAYERIVYPEERMREALAWHLRLPELGAALSYPVIGYALGYLCSTPACFRASFLVLAIYGFILTPYIMLFRPARLHEEPGEKEEKEGWRKYSVFLAAEALFAAAWSLAPSLALVYLVAERYGGNMFHIALAEASISLATLVGAEITDRVRVEKAFKALQAGTLVTLAGIAALILGDTLPLLLAGAFTTRLGDTVVFVFKRTWLFGLMGRREASMITAYLSSFRRVISLLSPLLAGLLAYLDPRTPYLACLLLLASTIPIYAYAQRSQAHIIQYTA